jgi:hypothetical protein
MTIRDSCVIPNLHDLHGNVTIHWAAQSRRWCQWLHRLKQIVASSNPGLRKIVTKSSLIANGWSY